jgi:hypothetical protein
MKERCLACGVEKDRSVKEVYPYSEDGLIDDPIDPMIAIDCQGGADWRRATVCFDCFHNLSPDMWINEAGWQSLNPVTPFDQLPKLPET